MKAVFSPPIEIAWVTKRPTSISLYSRLIPIKMKNEIENVTLNVRELNKTAITKTKTFL